MTTKKKNSDIVLKVPMGDRCLGCMFLTVNYLHNLPECKLFDVKLYCKYRYGGVDESSIQKCDECPQK